MISVQRLEEIGMDCLPEDVPPPSTPIILANGIRAKFGFLPEKIEEHQDEIHSMLLELPEEFRQGVGGGMSFLSACTTKDGEQWTGSHPQVETLMVLGLAAGWVEYCLPEMFWGALPGGMPYFVVLTERKKVEPQTLEKARAVH